MVIGVIVEVTDLAERFVMNVRRLITWCLMVNVFRRLNVGTEHLQ